MTVQFANAGTSAQGWDLVWSSPPLSVVQNSQKAETPENAADRPETHGYHFYLQYRVHNSTSTPDHKDLMLTLCAVPVTGCESYSLLVDYVLTLLQGSTELRVRHVESELLTADVSVQENEPFWLIQSDLPCSEDLTYGCRVNLKVRQTLSGRTENLNEETGYRDFALLITNRQFHVNVNYLADLGCELFDDWLSLRRKGHKRVVIWDWDPDELERYLQALCTYRTPNILFMLEMSSRVRVTKALRACERYLMDSKNIHIIRKLELSAEFGFGMLGDTCVRELESEPHGALSALHDYAELCGHDLTHMHPDVLEALGVFDDHVIIE